MGRKVKSLESQLEKQQQELNAGQQGVRVCVSANPKSPRPPRLGAKIYICTKVPRFQGNAK